LEEYRQEDTTKLRVTNQEIVVHLMENMNYAIGERQVRRIKQYRDVILWKKSKDL